MQSIQLASQKPAGGLPSEPHHRRRRRQPAPTMTSYLSSSSISSPRGIAHCANAPTADASYYLCANYHLTRRAPILVREAVPQTLLVLVRRILSTYLSAVNPTCCAASTPSQPSAWMGRRACGVGALHAGALSGLRRCMGQTLFPQSSHRIEHPSYIHPSTP